MFYSESRKGALGSIWVAAYFFKKLKKAQVTQTHIPTSVDKILQDELDVFTYRVLAYLLLGVVRIFSKKVEYLYDDCNKVLLKINDFVVSNKEMALVQTLRAPNFSITLPERFELDAFNLDILEDTSGVNLMPIEDITMKDSMWKAGAIVPYSVDTCHNEEVSANQDICSAKINLNEDSLLSPLIDCNIMGGPSHNLSSLKVSTEKFQENRSNLHESMNLELLPAVEIQPLCAVPLSVEDPRSEAAQLGDLIVMESDELHEEQSMQDIWDTNIFGEAGLSFLICGEVEKEPVNAGKSPGLHHLTDGNQIKVPDISQSENGNHEEDGNLNNHEETMEKLRENVGTLGECRNIEMSCMVEEPREQNRSIDEKKESNTDHQMLLEVDEPPENTRPFGEECQSTTNLKTPIEMMTPGSGTCQTSTEDHPLSLTIDTTPQSRFHEASGFSTPDILLIPTPAAKEGARHRRKRRCFFDDMMVFPNNVIKQFIEDSSDLVSKRRKAPYTDVAAWRAYQISRLPQNFLESLIPCSSPELRSLLCGKKLKISESLDNAKVPQMFTSESPTVSRSVETVEPSEKLDKSQLWVDGQCVENMDSLERLNVSASPSVHKQGETVEPPENLGMPESPIAVRSLDQVTIAPETPVLHTKMLRSFESPEAPEFSNLDRPRLEFERAEQQISPNKEHELDLDMMNEEINSCEGDFQNNYGWSERTRVAVRCLHRSFLNQKKRGEEEIVNLLQLLEGRTKKESARLFYEILIHSGVCFFCA
ncbi:sister chromatid cohesion 1 protein 2 isoform X2 [Mercurialis annua]|uniref:sister chromatid cohesion 1 protein 2 isoform X2 n=1 Tax=Mercurialis annua TaxID=3986 RepID=UPI0021610232|nr:sister chromatid cohesion 1 protein 2 isoform X2 [Mercurialis annua]